MKIGFLPSLRKFFLESRSCILKRLWSWNNFWVDLVPKFRIFIFTIFIKINKLSKLSMLISSSEVIIRLRQFLSQIWLQKFWKIFSIFYGNWHPGLWKCKSNLKSWDPFWKSLVLNLMVFFQIWIKTLVSIHNQKLNSKILILWGQNFRDM